MVEGERLQLNSRFCSIIVIIIIFFFFSTKCRSPGNWVCQTCSNLLLLFFFFFCYNVKMNSFILSGFFLAYEGKNLGAIVGSVNS
jgi:hypothetical protein